MRTFSSKERTNSRRSFRRRRHVIYGALLTGALLLLLTFFGSALGPLASQVTSPFRIGATWVATTATNISAYVTDRHALVLERDRLLDQLAHDSTRDLTIAELHMENEELRALLGASPSTRIAAGVAMRPNATPYDTLLIDRGSVHGITEHAAVYAKDNVVIGFVHRVFPTSALVTLLTAPGIESTAYIYGPDVYAKAEGIGGGVLVVSVPQGITLSRDDLVVLPAIDGGYVGAITHLESEESSPEQYGFVTSPVTFSSLRFVSVSTVPLAEIDFEQAEAIVERIRDDILFVEIPTDIIVSTSTPTTTPEETVATTSTDTL